MGSSKKIIIDDDGKFPCRMKKDYGDKPPLLLRVGYGPTGLFVYDAVSKRKIMFQHYDPVVTVNEGEIQSVSLTFYSDKKIIDPEAEEYLKEQA